MSIALTVNGNTYDYPEQGDLDWGQDASDWASAVTSGMLQKAGGSFVLLAEVDFGPTYGLKSSYYKSRNSNPASSGVFRLGNSENISWRNQANNADLNLTVNSSNNLIFNGNPLGSVNTVSDTNSIDLTLTGQDLTADVKLSSDPADANNQEVDLQIETDGIRAQIPNASIIAAIPNADTSTTGLLTNTDWNTFNNKQPAITNTIEIESSVGSKTTMSFLTEELTLSGASVTSTIKIPQFAVCFGVTQRVSEAITGATSYDCGISGNLSKFGSTLGTSLNNSHKGITYPETYYDGSGTSIVITANGSNFTDGKLIISLHIMTFDVPDSI